MNGSAWSGLAEFVRTVLTVGWRRPLDIPTAWKERHSARRASVEALAVYDRVRRAHPGLTGRALYRQVVIENTGVDGRAADQLMEAADHSFAEWPIERDLVFRDVVHYMVYDQYTGALGGRHWTREHIGVIVDSVIPKEL